MTDILRLVVAILSALLPLVGSCGCGIDATSRSHDVGTGAAMADVGPGATVHNLTFADGSLWPLAAAVVPLAAAAAGVAYLLYRSKPKDPPQEV